MRAIPSIALLVVACALGVATTDASDLSQETKLVAADPQIAHGFGAAVAMDGDTILVGAFQDDDNGAGAGAAYVFRRDGSTWAEEAKLTADDGAAVDFFGFAVDIDGDTAIVGALQNDALGPDSGSVYVFRRDGSTWTQEAKLNAADGSAIELFGFAVGVSGDTAIVGLPIDGDNGVESGSAYVFRREASGWVQEAKLLPDDGTAFAVFGAAVAIDGDVAAIGAFNDPEAGVSAGAAYVFRRTSSGWVQETKLTAGDAAAGDHFGQALALSGSTLLVGAMLDDDNGTDSGSAYVFEDTGSGWTERAKLTDGDGVESDFFGWSVAADGDLAAVGSIGIDDVVVDAGAVFVYRRDASGWVEDQVLTAGDPDQNDRFGFSVAASGDAVTVGADLDDESAPQGGAVYVYEPGGNVPPVAAAVAAAETECTSPDGAVVTLDASDSIDPDAATDAGGIESFEWFEDFGLATERLLGTGEILEVTLSLGMHAITLRVTDEFGETDTDEIDATVVDTTAPEISIDVDPDTLWPPNHRLVGVHFTVSAVDACGSPEVGLASVASDEADDAPGKQDGDTNGDIRGADIGTADFDMLLRAERAGSGDGRVYTAVYTAADVSGNDVTGSATVTVPHDLGSRASDPGTPGKPNKQGDGSAGRPPGKSR